MYYMHSSVWSRDNPVGTEFRQLTQFLLTVRWFRILMSLSSLSPTIKITKPPVQHAAELDGFVKESLSPHHNHPAGPGDGT